MADLSCDAGVATPCVLAVVQIDDCTNEIIEGDTIYAFDGVRNVNWEPQMEEAETAVFKDNCGNIVCRHDDNCDQLTGFSLEFEKCILPFELLNLLTGQPIVTDGGDTVGWYHTTDVKCPPRVAVLLWEKKIDCRNGAWRKTIFPNVKFTMPTPGAEGDLIRIQTLNAMAQPGYLAAYGDGPFHDDDVLGFALLDPVKQGAIAQYDTDVAPPVAQCGLLEYAAVVGP